MLYAVIVVQFTASRYTVNEGGPPIQICVNLVEGSVGTLGLTVNVASIAGGTAVGKTYC